jgi:hypothetical protein
MFRRWLPWLCGRSAVVSLGLGEAFDGYLLCECADGNHSC